MSLELTIGANVQPAVTAIEQMKASLASLKTQLSKTTDPTEVNRLSSAIVNQKNEIQQALASTNAFANSTFGVSRAARIAHSDLDQAARSVELMSHGSEGAVTGLSNLVFTFERLKGSTGSTSSALGALSEAFFSPAGLLIGAAALLPILTEGATKFYNLATGADRAKAEVEELTAALKRSKSELEGFNSDLDAANVTRKLKIDIATPQGLERTVKDLQSDLQTAQLKIVNNTAATEEWNNQVEKLKKTNDDLAKSIANTAQNGPGLLSINRDKNEIEANKQKITKLQDQISEFKKDTERAQDDVINIPLKIQLAQTDKAREDARKAAEQLKKELEKASKDGFIFHIQPHPDVPSLENGKDSIFEKLKEDINKKVPPIDVKVPINIQAHLDQRGEAVKQVQKNLDDLNKIVSNGMADVAASFAQGIGTILGGGDISSAFQAIFKSIGGAFQALGKAMIAQAIAVIAIKNAFKNPFVELAAGAGLIIAGTALQSAIGKTTKFATGGLVFGPTLGLIGEGSGTSRTNPEVIAPLDKLRGMLSGLAGGGEGFVAKTYVEGQNIALVLDRVNRSNKRNT